jgi:hypothetical protein
LASLDAAGALSSPRPFSRTMNIFQDGQIGVADVVAPAAGRASKRRKPEAPDRGRFAGYLGAPAPAASGQIAVGPLQRRRNWRDGRVRPGIFASHEQRHNARFGWRSKTRQLKNNFAFRHRSLQRSERRRRSRSNPARGDPTSLKEPFGAYPRNCSFIHFFIYGVAP